MKHFLITLLILFSVSLQAQEITEENYRKLDNEIWDTYQQQVDSIFALIERFPERKDSLMKFYHEILDIAYRRNEQAALKYASVPGGLQRVFMLRLDFPKDTVRAVWNNLADEMKNSPYGKSIQLHLETDQIGEGDRYHDLDATDVNGNPFRLSSLEGKNIILLYDGMGCMGAEGRDYLKQLYESTSRNDLEIVVYCIASSLEKLREYPGQFNLPFIFVSDFKMDHTPFKIIYGTQATPTVFVINKNGVVEIKSRGVPTERISEFKVKNKL